MSDTRLTIRQARALAELEGEVAADSPLDAMLFIDNEWELGSGDLLKVGYGQSKNNGYYDQNWLVGRDGEVIKL